MGFRFSASLDSERFRNDFEQLGYVHISDVLPNENAQRLRKAMLEDTSWNLVFNDRDRHIDMPPAQYSMLSPEKIRELHHAIYAQAQNSFQYCYNNYPIFDAHRAGKNKGHVLHQFWEWLNGDEFLGFARVTTGFDDINLVDAQATRYKSGHFLTTHDDVQEGKNRRAAYIFNFTPDWPADWGGYLQLLDENEHVRRGLRPTFNTLNILAVPQKHNVSIVTPFAGGMRTSISGWFRYEDAD